MCPVPAGGGSRQAWGRQRSEQFRIGLWGQPDCCQLHCKHCRFNLTLRGSTKRLLFHKLIFSRERGEGADVGILEMLAARASGKVRAAALA